MVARNRPFLFDALTYAADERRSSADYLTMFRIPGKMRANLFTYWQPTDERISKFSKDPKESLLELLPGLENVIDDFDIPGEIERACIDLYVVDPPREPGVVFVADAYQSVCPSTGTGLSKMLTEIDILLDNKIDEWLSSPGLDTNKLASFYAEPRKVAEDRRSLTSAIRRRNAALERSTIRWWFNRVRRTYRRYKLISKLNTAKS